MFRDSRNWQVVCRQKIIEIFGWEMGTRGKITNVRRAKTPGGQGPAAGKQRQEATQQKDRIFHFSFVIFHFSFFILFYHLSFFSGDLPLAEMPK